MSAPKESRRNPGLVIIIAGAMVGLSLMFALAGSLLRREQGQLMHAAEQVQLIYEIGSVVDDLNEFVRHDLDVGAQDTGADLEPLVGRARTAIGNLREHVALAAAARGASGENGEERWRNAGVSETVEEIASEFELLVLAAEAYDSRPSIPGDERLFRGELWRRRQNIRNTLRELIVEERSRLADRTREAERLWQGSAAAVVMLTPLGALLAGLLARRTSRRERILAVRAERERELAAAATAAKDRFLANMSHEMRTPMNGVLGMAQLLQQGPLDRKQRRRVDTILRSGQTLLAILDDILDMSSIEAGKLRIREKVFDVDEVIEKVFDLLGPAAKSKGVRLARDLPPEARSPVIGDPLRVTQVLSNLVGNAVKFTVCGEVVVRVSTVPHEEGGVVYRFEVADTGIGIAPDEVDRIFNAFEQVNRTHESSLMGTGLGLSISRSLVTLMGGEMGLESELGVGSTFWFSLRFAEPAVAPLSQPSHSDVESPRAATALALRLLVVDDDPVSRAVAIEMTEDLGCSSVGVSSGHAALLSLRDNEYDAVLMDCEMQVMNGFETTRRIRSCEREDGAARLPIVALTAKAMAGDREACLDAGMDDYLRKPFEAADLHNVLQRVAGTDVPHVRQARRDASAVQPETLLDDVALAGLAALRRTGAAERIITLYRENLPGYVELLRDAIADGDPTEVAAAAHRIKSGSGTVGCAGIHSVAHELEEAARGGDLSRADDLYDAIVALVPVADTALADWLRRAA